MPDIQQIAKKIFSKSKNYFLSLFGGTPKRYWSFLLILFFALLIGVFALDGIIFRNITSSAFRDIYIVPNTELKGVNKEALTEVVQSLQSKEENFAKTLSAEPIKDPSR